MPDVVVAASLDASTLEDKRTRYIPAAAAEPELQADDMDEDWLQQFLEDFATLRLVLRRWASPAWGACKQQLLTLIVTCLCTCHAGALLLH